MCHGESAVYFPAERDFCPPCPAQPIPDGKIRRGFVVNHENKIDMSGRMW